MKYLYIITVLAFSLILYSESAFAGGCATGACGSKGPKRQASVTKPKTEQHAKATNIDGATLSTLIKANTAVVILDARSAKYDDGRRIPGAISLSYSASAEDVAKVIPAKDSLVVTYCANLKCPASAKLAKHLSKLGYTNILEYPAGIDGWESEGRKVVRTNIN